MLTTSEVLNTPDLSPGGDPLAAVRRAPWHLSREQVQHFDGNGYLILRNRVSGELLRRAQAAGDRWIERGLELEQSTPAGHHGGDFVFAQRAGGKVLFRVNYLHDKGEPASLELLGSPEILGIAESFCGPNFVPTYESMVFKMPGDGEAIPWHQDAVFPRKFRVFNVDIYLDESTAQGGALRVVPGSHRQVHDVCNFAAQHGWNHPKMITVEMQPGDVLVHDDMILHGSPATIGNRLRRTIYFEFRSAEQIIAEGPFDADFVEKRFRLIPLALRRHRAAFPDASQFEWQADAARRTNGTASEAEELRIIHKVHTPGSYCSASAR